jgi:solute:Na+ symporter, SSS family
VPPRDGMQNLASWIAGCVLVYASLFGVGKVIFGETALGLGMLAVAAGAGWLIYRSLERSAWRTVVE